ncbi:MAG TPA: hypothetical protein VM163_02730 [bacterium]|nr:hypothetical protein [bacterium]
MEADGFLIRRPGWEIRTDLWDVATWIERGAPIRREADARLMAAAPEMLVACEAMLAAINAYRDTDISTMRFFSLLCEGETSVNAALAKAKGE